MSYEYNKLAKRVLGKEEAEKLYGFFNDILAEAADLKSEYEDCKILIVTATSRCEKLFNTYYRELKLCANNSAYERPDVWKGYSSDKISELVKTFENCVVTSDNALAMSYSIMNGFMSDMVFPQIIVVDDLMVYGRKLNTFLYTLEKRLLDAKNQCHDDLKCDIGDENFVNDIFLNSLTIKVANKGSGYGVLLSRYRKNLINNNPWINDKKYQKSLTDFRYTSLAYRRYAYISGASSTGLNFGVRLPKQLAEQTAVNKGNTSFIKVDTELQGIKQSNWVYAYPNSQNPKLLCVVRCITNRADGSELYTPFMIVDHVNTNQILNVHSQLVNEANEMGKVNAASLLAEVEKDLPVDKSSYINKNRMSETLMSWSTNTNSLVLTSWILKEFMQSVKGLDHHKLVENVEFSQVIPHYMAYDTDSDASKAYDKTLIALKEIWDLEPSRDIHEYLDSYTSGAYIVSNGNANIDYNTFGVKIDECSKTLQNIEDAIQDIGAEDERNVYTLYGSGISFSDAAMTSYVGAQSLESVLNEVSKNCPEGFRFYGAVAVIAQAIDSGFIDVSVIVSKNPSNDRFEYELYTWIRIENEAMFFIPIRYRNYLAVLDEIQELCEKDFGAADFKIGIFVRSLAKDIKDRDTDRLNVISIPVTDKINMTDDQLVEGLSKLYKQFVKSGQRFKDWEIYSDMLNDSEDRMDIIEYNRMIRVSVLWIYRNR